MLKKLLCHTILVYSLFMSSSAFALISGQVQMGKKWYETKHSDGNKFSWNGQQTTFSVLIDPIPLIPIAFGPSYSIININENSMDKNASSALSNQLNLDLVGWVPFFPVVTPYIGYRQVISAKLQIEYDANSKKFEEKISGSELRFGFMYGLLPLVDLLFEVNQSSLKIAKLEGKSSQTLNARSFLLGVDVGI